MKKVLVLAVLVFSIITLAMQPPRPTLKKVEEWFNTAMNYKARGDFGSAVEYFEKAAKHGGFFTEEDALVELIALYSTGGHDLKKDSKKVENYKKRLKILKEAYGEIEEEEVEEEFEENGEEEDEDETLGSEEESDDESDFDDVYFGLIEDPDEFD